LHPFDVGLSLSLLDICIGKEKFDMKAITPSKNGYLTFFEYKGHIKIQQLLKAHPHPMLSMRRNTF